MGMDLLHGGHLTHGSPVNRSGKLYNAVHYTVDPVTEQINYDAVEELARKTSPKFIIAGYSSYPWAVDWKRFRAIADETVAKAPPDGYTLLMGNIGPIAVKGRLQDRPQSVICGQKGLERIYRGECHPVDLITPDACPPKRLVGLPFG